MRKEVEITKRMLKLGMINESEIPKQEKLVSTWTPEAVKSIECMLTETERFIHWKG